MPFIRCTLCAVLLVVAHASVCGADEVPRTVCEMVSPRQLAALYPSTLYASRQENGCRWCDAPNGTAYFQIGIIRSPKPLRQYFEKQIPANHQLGKINDLGDRGLFIESNGYLSVIAIREGGWVLISTVDLLFIKQGEARHELLWDIYREILKSLD